MTDEQRAEIKAETLIQDFFANIEQPCNQSSTDAHYNAAIKSAILHVDKVRFILVSALVSTSFYEEVKRQLNKKLYKHNLEWAENTKVND